MPGYRQRLAEEQPEEDEAELPNVVQVLLLQRSQGEVSATAIQRIAAALVLDGFRIEPVMELAALGAFGAYPGNIFRDLKSKHGKAVQVAEPYKLRVPVLDPRSAPRQSLEDAGMLLPHDLFCSIGREYPDQFDSIFGIADLPSFWGQIRSDDFHFGADLQPDQIDSHHTIPMWLHGDGVAFGERDSLMVLSFGSLTSSLAPSSACLFCAAFAKKVTATSAKNEGDDTWRNIWQPLAWSLECLFEGKHPERSHDGKPWQPGTRRANLAGQDLLPTGPWKGILWSLVGDYEYMANVLKLPHWKSNAMCGFCDCDKTKPAKSPWNFAKPGWVTKQPNDFQNSPVWRTPHPVFQISAVHDLSVQFDVLHLLDLGTSQTLAASVVKEIIYHDMGDDVETNLGRFWESVWNEYGRLGSSSRISNLTLGMVVTDTKSPHKDYPRLKLKAAETRHFIPVLASICMSFQSCKQHRVRSEVLQALTSFYELLEVCDYVPTAEQHREMTKVWWSFLKGYQWLSDHAAKKGMKLYDPVPKFHYSAHLPEQAKFLNPRKTWTYRNEDYVGLVASIASSCAFGTRAPALSLKTAEKLRFFMHFSWAFKHEE
ncbi:unnamed protein product [Symbiodinium sp. CCMP2592]|nr:unnamed protein product [Symbiodinium sp. CCMP2592]